MIFNDGTNNNIFLRFFFCAYIVIIHSGPTRLGYLAVRIGFIINLIGN